MPAVYAEEWGCFPVLHCKKHWWQWGVSLAPSFTRRRSTFDRLENTRAGELWPSVLSTAKAEAVCLTPLQTHCSQPRSFLLITILSGFPKRLLSFPHPVLSMLGRYLSAETGNKIESESPPYPECSWALALSLLRTTGGTSSPNAEGAMGALLTSGLSRGQKMSCLIRKVIDSDVCQYIHLGAERQGHCAHSYPNSLEEPCRKVSILF